MTAEMKQMYLISDDSGAALGRGKLVSPPDAEEMQILVLDDQIDDVIEYNSFQLMNMSGQAQILECRMVRYRGDRIVLKKTGVKAMDARRNLRVPVRFDTFLYPITGMWRGRMRAQTIDLSSGGVAFQSGEGLDIGEELEIAVPAQEGPLLLRCHLLRTRELEDGAIFYAAKFVDLCEDEEVLVREEVFSIQLENRRRRKD